MKKGLLLSIVASTMIFAGGDIAPVEPAAAAPAADCSDFYGNVGLQYRTTGTEYSGHYFQKEKNQDGEEVSVDKFGTKKTDLFDKHAVSATVTLGVVKAIAHGIGFGAEISGTTGFGAVADSGDWNPNYGDDAKLTMLYLTASFGNTAIKAGRYELPKKLSPYVWTDTTDGMKDMTFEGVLVANTDLADTTIYGTYLHSRIVNDKRTYFNFQKKNDELGAFALGFVNTSIADTKLSAVGYYLPNAAYDAVKKDAYVAYAAFVTADTTFAGLKASARVGFVAGDDEVIDKRDATGKLLGADATFGVSAMIAGSMDMFRWDLRGTYINDGDFDIGVQNPFYTGIKQFAGVAASAVEANLYSDIGPGTLNARLKYTSWDTNKKDDGETAFDDQVHARLGYGMKVFGDVSAKVEYRYTKTSLLNGAERTDNQIRVDATYKF